MDSCCFIELAKTALFIDTPSKIEPHIFYSRKFLDAARAGDIKIYTSTMSVIECVSVRDVSLGTGAPPIEHDGVKALFRGMLMSAKSGVWPVIPTPRITEAARDLRWVHKVTCKPMDALHIATALEMRCTNFFTIDDFGAENIKKIASLELAVSSADKAIDLLPDKYRQYELKPATSRNLGRG